MKKRIINIVLVGALFITISLCGCAKEQESLRMVIVPAGSPLEEKERWQPMVDYLSEEIGIPIELVVTTDFSTAIVAMKTGNADIGRFGPFSYVMAVMEADVVPLVREVITKTGKASYKTYIIARGDSGYDSLDDLEGTDFAFVEATSTSGYLVPLTIFKDEGIDVDTYFRSIQYAGSHDVVIVSVKEGQIDAGASNSNRWEIALDQNVIEEGELVIIQESGPIPSSPTVVSQYMSDEVSTNLLNAYLNMPMELSDETFGVSEYIQAYDEDYDYIRLIAEVLDLDLSEMS